MQKYLHSLLLTAFLCSLQISNAQPTVVAESAQFKAFSLSPALWQLAYFKVVALEDGGAALLHLDKKNFDFMVYNADQSLRFNKKIKTETKLRLDIFGGGSMLACLQTGENITLLFQQATKKREPELIRVVLSPKTGAIVSEEVLQTLPKVTAGDYFKYGTMNQFFVRKSDETGSYAVAAYTPAGAENEKLNVSLYNSNNKQIAQSFLKIGKKYGRAEFLDMTVNDQEVVVLVIAYNLEENVITYNPYNGIVPKKRVTWTTNGTSAVIVGSLRAGEKTFEPIHKIDYQNAYCVSSGLVKFNAAMNQYNLLTSEETRKGFDVQLGILNSDLSSLNGKAVDFSKISNVAFNEQNKKDLQLLPQNMFINSKGGTVLFMEELTHVIDLKNGRIIQSILGDIGVLRLAKDGNPVGGNYIPARHVVAGDVEPLEFARDEFKGGSASWDGFKSPYYVPAGRKGYVLMNDFAKNEEVLADKQEPIKMTSIGGAGGGEAFYFDLAEDEMPQREPLFKTDGKRKWCCFFDASDYNKKTKMLITLAQDVYDKKGFSKIVWIKMQTKPKKQAE